MFTVDDDAEKAPHIIPGQTNDKSEGMTFAEHLHTNLSDIEESEAESLSSNIDTDEDDDSEESSLRPLI